MDKKLNTKDLINIGIFTALYFAIVFIVALLWYIPVMMVIMPALCALIGGIPFIMFLTRARKFGMVTIMGTLLGLLTFLLGRPWPSILFGVIAGLAADLYLKGAEDLRIRKAPLSCGIFSLWIVGMALRMFFRYRVSYFESMRPGYGDAYVDALSRLTPSWMFWVLVATIFLGGLLGGLLGTKILKKHFVKAGMA